ncbi:MAG TPA: Mrp/NBP35 family ATP-binding protein [Gemmatimonadaceae bacterium]|jgi:ATP-binding protein involved in chromosome partitioning|nr:Mrp/NBP35 family ATP-binding protein [Gemmatimonadaceae bacterium]
MTTTLQERIATSLSRLRNPRTGADLFSTQQVRDIATTTTGRVKLTLLLAPHDDPALAKEVRQAVERVEGVTDIQLDVQAAAQTGPAVKPNAGRALPVMDQTPAAPARPAAPTPKHYPKLGKVIAISSGKGGVGKSTVAVNIAVALATSGARVGLMDADIYGPNIPRMMGVSGAPPVMNEKIIPLEAHGVKLISLGMMIEPDQPAIWRGPIVMKIINQFLQDVAWGQLDYFIVDMPPGTGDAQLSLVQATQVDGAVIVTTPQEVSVGDALRGVKMFQRVGVPVLGIVENMSWFECPHCGKPSALFGSGGGERLAKAVELPLLGQVPLYPRVMEGGDTGAPIVTADAQSSAAKALVAISQKVAGAFAV